MPSMGSGHVGFSSCGMWAQKLWHTGSVVVARRLSSCGACMGLVALRHVGSSQARARTHVPCIGRRILNHCATREAPFFLLGKRFIKFYSALQLSKILHMVSYNPIITLFSPTPILPLPLPLSLLVSTSLLSICVSASFLFYSLVHCIF